MHPEITALWESIERDKKRMLDAVKAMSEEQRNAPAPNHTWTPVQIIEHVVIVEMMYAGFLQQTDQAALAKAKPTRHLMYKMVRYAMVRKLQVPTIKDMEPTRKSFDIVQQEWKSVRDFIGKAVRATSENDEMFLRHSMFGAMSVHQTLELMQLHLDYHLPQVGVTP